MDIITTSLQLWKRWDLSVDSFSSIDYPVFRSILKSRDTFTFDKQLGKHLDPFYAVFAHSSRWVSLCLEGSSLDEIGSLEKSLAHFPILETLRIYLQYVDDPSDDQDWRGILDLFADCPALKSADIRTDYMGVTSQAFRLPWIQLEELHMEIPGGLSAVFLPFCTSLVSSTISYVWDEPWFYSCRS